MAIINIHQAKTHFSKLVDSAMKGDEVIIAKSGKPVARLVAIKSEKPKRHLGALKGQIVIAADFDAPLPQDVLDAFEGKE